MGKRRTRSRPSGFQILFVLSIGLLAMAFGSIFVRLSQEAPSLVIAFFRMFFASVILLPFYLLDNSSERKANGVWLLTAGTALALHFAFWVSSLAYTSVAVSVLLVNTSPVLVATCSHFIYKERLTPSGILGITLTLLGSTLLFTNDLYTKADWRGATLSLAGAVMLGIYLLAGRRIRQQTSLIRYVYPTYVLATLVLGAFVLAADLPVIGFSKDTYPFLFLLGLVPQCVGHTSYNWSLRHIPATVVSTLFLAEPILASLLAYWILEEAIGKTVVLGGAVVGIGIFLVSRSGILPRPRIEVAAAVLTAGGKVWIQKRETADHLAGYWEFPGGKIQANEFPAQALVREIREELGIELKECPEQPILVQDHVYPERRVRIHFFLIPLDLQLLGKGQWVSPGQLDQFNFPPANGPVIEKIRHLSGTDS